MSLSKLDLWLRGFSPTARYEGEGEMSIPGTTPEELIVELTAEVKRLTEALAASDADRDRMAQQLALAQSEARGLREELRRISAPNGGVA